MLDVFFQPSDTVVDVEVRRIEHELGRGFPVPPWGVVAENSDRLRPIRKEIADRGLHFLCQRACL